MTRSFVTVLLCVATSAHADHAHDDRTATCERLRAEARAEAVLLYAPKLEAMAARSPKLVEVTDPTIPTVALQVRGDLRVSPTEMLQGRAVERIADAECLREQASARLEDLIALGPRIGELAATRAELTFLRSHITEVDAIVDATVARVEHQRSTALELSDVRSRRVVLRRHIAELDHNRAMLEEVDRGEPAPASLHALAARYRDTTLDVDHEHAALRDLRAWHLDVRGGVGAGERADWFAIVEVGYSLGGLWQPDADRRALRARREELASDSRSLATRLDELTRMMKHSVESLAAELAELDAEIAELRDERRRVEAIEGDAARELRDRLTLELVLGEGRHTYVEALLAARRPYLGDTK